MGRKKEKKPAKPELPKRLYAWYLTTPQDPFPPHHWLNCEEKLNEIGGAPREVGEYVLVRRGTTQTILEVEKD